MLSHLEPQLDCTIKNNRLKHGDDIHKLKVVQLSSTALIRAEVDAHQFFPNWNERREDPTVDKLVAETTEAKVFSLTMKKIVELHEPPEIRSFRHSGSGRISHDPNVGTGYSI